jgi:hypothetical protein
MNALESTRKIGFFQVILTLLSLVLAMIASIAAVFKVVEYESESKMIAYLAAFISLLFSISIYNLIFGQIINSSIWVLWIFIIIGTPIAFFVFVRLFWTDDTKKVFISAYLGSYMFIRGISLIFTDTYPNEFTMNSQLYNE